MKKIPSRAWNALLWLSVPWSLPMFEALIIRRKGSHCRGNDHENFSYKWKIIGFPGRTL